MEIMRRDPNLTRLPVEVIQPILEEAVRLKMGNHPKQAASLQLISRVARLWLAPLIYRSFIVYCGYTSTGSPHHTFSMFLDLRRTSGGSIRHHIKHILFVKLPPSGARQPEFDVADRASWDEVPVWRLDSVAVGDGLDPSFVGPLNLAPRHVVLRSSRPGALPERLDWAMNQTRLGSSRLIVVRDISLHVLHVSAGTTPDQNQWKATAEALRASALRARGGRGYNLTVRLPIVIGEHAEVPQGFVSIVGSLLHHSDVNVVVELETPDPEHPVLEALRGASEELIPVQYRPRLGVLFREARPALTVEEYVQQLRGPASPISEPVFFS